MSGKRVWMLLSVMVLVASGLRVGVAVGHPMTPVISGDAYDYHVLGERLATSGQYMVDGRRYVRMPGYPAFLAMVYWCAGPSDTAALVVQAVLGGLMVLPVYFLGRRVSERVGVVASMLVAVDPLSVAFSAALLSETVFTLVMLISLWVVVRIVEKGGFGWWLLLGALWAAGVYLRASGLYLIVPLAAIGAAYGRGGAIRRICGPVAAIGVVVAALAPWQAAHIVHDRAGYLALTSLEGISLYEAVYPDAEGGPRQQWLQPTREMENMNEMQRNDEWSREAWGFVRQEPGRIAALALRKMARTWNPAFNAGELQSGLIQMVSVAWHVPLYVLGLVGVFGRLIRWRIRWVLLSPVVYYTLVHGLYLGSVRYRVPLMPVWCVFAAAGAITLWDRYGHKRRAPATV